MAKKTNVTINGKEYYRIRLTIGTDKEGNPIVKNFYGESKSDAERRRDEWLKKGKGKSNSSLTMAMYEWLWDVVKPSKLKPATFDRYEGIYRNYFEKSSLGIMRLADIDRAVIRKYYNELFSRNKTYSQIKNAHKLLNKFFKYMIDEEILEKNPCAGMDLSQYKAQNEDFNFDDFEDFEEGSQIETFNEEEIKIILDNIPNKKLKILVAFALGTGLRQGEILALKETDIKDMNVYVTKTVKTVKVYDDKDKKYHYETIVTPPKTKNSRRIVPIPSSLKNDLIELNKIRNIEKLKLGELYQDNGLLFPSETGTYIDARNLSRAWERALKKAGVPYKKFHALRHTYATQLLKNGTQLITVSRLLGHSTVKTTEIYAHVLESTKHNEVEALNQLFD